MYLLHKNSYMLWASLGSCWNIVVGFKGQGNASQTALQFAQMPVAPHHQSLHGQFVFFNSNLWKSKQRRLVTDIILVHFHSVYNLDVYGHTLFKQCMDEYFWIVHAFQIRNSNFWNLSWQKLCMHACMHSVATASKRPLTLSWKITSQWNKI